MIGRYLFIFYLNIKQPKVKLDIKSQACKIIIIQNIHNILIPIVYLYSLSKVNKYSHVEYTSINYICYTLTSNIKINSFT